MTVKTILFAVGSDIYLFEFILREILSKVKNLKKKRFYTFLNYYFYMFAQIPYEMKQALTLFISGISFLFWTSCSTQQALVSTTKHTKQQPRFLEDVTLQHQVSNTRNIKQEKQIYQNEQDDPALVITSESNALNINSTKNLYDFIEEWYGVPYRMGGTTKKGIDCSAFVQELYGEVYQT